MSPGTGCAGSYFFLVVVDLIAVLPSARTVASLRCLGGTFSLAFGRSLFSKLRKVFHLLSVCDCGWLGVLTDEPLPSCKRPISGAGQPSSRLSVRSR